MDNIYYVYTHVDPITGELVYVGKGCGGRAWDVTRNRGQHSEHLSWMKSLMNQGFIPSDWVNIIKKNLLDKEAREKEIELIHSIGLIRFNRQTGENQHQSKLTNDQAVEIFKIVSKDKTQIGELANKYNVSRAAIYMILNRKQWRAVTAGVSID